MFRTKSFWTLAIACCVGAAGCTTSAIDVAAPSSSAAVPVADRAEQSTALLEATLPPDGPGCSAAAGIDGEVVWADAAGLADLDTRAPLTTATRFNTASMTKQFTGAAILLLEQEGKLAETDPLSMHIPDLPDWARRITVQDLLHHTSGLREVGDLLRAAGHTSQDPLTSRQALAAIAQIEELNFEPGTVFEYSNSNYVLLAEIVHLQTGLELPAFLQERVFGPLDLTMSFGPDPTTDDVAGGYTTQLGQRQRSDSAWLIPGPGAFLTDPGEMVRWTDNYRTGAVGGTALLDGFTRDAYPMTSAAGADRYGAGIAVQEDGTLYHDGWTDGQVSKMFVAPDRRTAIAINCNRDDDPEMFTGLTEKLREIWFGRA